MTPRKAKSKQVTVRIRQLAQILRPHFEPKIIIQYAKISPTFMYTNCGPDPYKKYREPNFYVDPKPFKKEFDELHEIYVDRVYNSPQNALGLGKARTVAPKELHGLSNIDMLVQQNMMHNPYFKILTTKWSRG